MTGYRETESGLLVPHTTPEEQRALIRRVIYAVEVSGLVDSEETGSLLVGLDVASRHPEWARAVIEALNVHATEEELQQAAAQIRALVEACPMTVDHEPEQAEEPST